MSDIEEGVAAETYVDWDDRLSALGWAPDTLKSACAAPIEEPIGPRLDRLEGLVRQLLARTELAELPLEFAIGLFDRQSLERQRNAALKALKESGG